MLLSSKRAETPEDLCRRRCWRLKKVDCGGLGVNSGGLDVDNGDSKVEEAEEA
ncbi:hypothetical protein YC2023_076227 [Brassica napus]